MFERSKPDIGKARTQSVKKNRTENRRSHFRIVNGAFMGERIITTTLVSRLRTCRTIYHKSRSGQTLIVVSVGQTFLSVGAGVKGSVAPTCLWIWSDRQECL